MENIILSLLLIKSMTIYEMKMFIEQSLNTVCSSSLGSIQTALKKLISKNCIEVYEYKENKLLKKEYSITKEGLEQFLQWIKTPMNLQKEKNMESGKFFFLGIASYDVRLKSIAEYIKSLELELDKLLQIKTFVEEHKEHAIEVNVSRIRGEEKLEEHLLYVSGETDLYRVVQNIYNYQIYSLEYGLTRLVDDISFYKEIYEREKKVL